MDSHNDALVYSAILGVEEEKRDYMNLFVQRATTDARLSFLPPPSMRNMNSSFYDELGLGAAMKEMQGRMGGP